MKTLTYGSVCSGIEAVSVAWSGLNLKPIWFSEIEPFPCAVLAHHYPTIPNHGDMTTLPDRILSGEIEAPDILVGGTPCQAFSVAGLRNSLNDERGNLTLVFVRILNAINTIRRRYGLPDAVVLWENVPGVLSTRDNAFGCFLAALLGESKELVPTGSRWTGAGIVRSDECEIAWRILDAQYFGVPQRRRRVFLVAGSRNRRVAEILFEQPGKSRAFKKGETSKKESSAFVESSFGTYRASDVGGTLKRTGGALSGGSETLLTSKIGATLTTAWSVNSDQIFNGNYVINYPKVRKLTPIECERLQGFPDNYTQIPWRNKTAEQCPDTPRYMAIGNSMAVPVMRWIGTRIILKDKQKDIS
jgi:cytosine-specific methyltransferase|nr:MAG TPA: Cytosine specific methyltransferase [Caudoviricetes sp.]